MVLSWCCHVTGGAEAFSETAEFVRSIQPLAPKAEDTASYMDVDDQPPAAAAAAAAAGGDASMLPPPPPTSKPPLAPKQRNYRKGGWVSAADDEQVCGRWWGGGVGVVQHRVEGCSRLTRRAAASHCGG
jgi:hypothetical protein